MIISPVPLEWVILDPIRLRITRLPKLGGRVKSLLLYRTFPFYSTHLYEIVLPLFICIIYCDGFAIFETSLNLVDDLSSQSSMYQILSCKLILVVDSPVHKSFFNYHLNTDCTASPNALTNASISSSS